MQTCYGYMYKNLDKGQFAMFLAFLNDEPVGFSMLHMKQEHACNNTSGVLEHARKHGVLTKMAHERMVYAQKNGVHYMHVQCMPTSLSAYEKMGFKASGLFHLFAFNP